MRRENKTAYPELAAELVRLKVDIIVTRRKRAHCSGGQECDQDDSHCHDGRGTDPVEEGSWRALPVPAVTSPALQPFRRLGGKRLELSKKPFPKVARVAVLYDPAFPGSCTRGKRGPPSPRRARWG